MNNVKAYRMTIDVMDFEGSPLDDIVERLENARYEVVHVMEVKQKDINNWDDDHPMNKNVTHVSASDEHFKDAPVVYKL